MTVSFPRDDNRVPTIGGTLNTDGSTPTKIAVNPANNALKVDDNTTGSNFTSHTTAQRDSNRVPVLWGVSSADFVTPVYIAVDSNNNLLIDSA